MLVYEFFHIRPFFEFMHYLSESGISYLTLSNDGCYQITLSETVDKALQQKMAEVYGQLLDSSINLLVTDHPVAGNQMLH